VPCFDERDSVEGDRRIANLLFHLQTEVRFAGRKSKKKTREGGGVESRTKNRRGVEKYSKRRILNLEEK
jgi:hypothetical protein